MSNRDMVYYIYRDALVMMKAEVECNYIHVYSEYQSKIFPKISGYAKEVCAFRDIKSCFCDNLTILKMVVLHPMQRFNNEVCIDNSFKNN